MRFGLDGREVEERGVEQLDVFEHRARPDEVRVAQRGRVGVRQLAVGEEPDGLHPVADVPPELVHTARAGEARDHPDDRHAERVVQFLVAH
jgi:hypothetical protein